MRDIRGIGYLPAYSVLREKPAMKKVIVASILITTFLLHSCEPTATFDKPQPDNIKPLASFPKRMQGKYLSSDQASIVTVTDKLLIRHFDFDVKVHKDSIGTSYKLIGDTLINITDSTKEIVSLRGDTVFQRTNWTDTLFNISRENILKKFKGYYFLNLQYQDNAWEVKKLSLENGLLKIGYISDKEDIQKLRELTETTTDTLSTHFGLTRRQFKKFVTEQGFSEEETFTRINETAGNTGFVKVRPNNIQPSQILKNYGIYNGTSTSRQ